MKNYADRRGCYSPRLKAQVDNIVRDQHNSSHHMKAEFNNCLLFIQNTFKFLTSLPAGRLSSKLWPLAQFQNINTGIFLQILLKKWIASTERYVLHKNYSCFPSIQFQSEIQLHIFRFWIAT